MRWAFLIALVVVAGAVAIFGTYRLTDDGAVAVDEQAQAELAAQEIACLARGAGQACGTINAISQEAPRIWKVDLNWGQTRGCFAVHLDDYRIGSSFAELRGVGDVPCGE